MEKVWAGGNWNLNLGVFHISRWIADFNPYNLVLKHSQVWIRLYGLAQEYWHRQNLLEIARGVGIPLQIDRATLNQVYGHYARILVEIDMSQTPPESIRVEREGFGFFVDVYYENLPAFCSHCQSVGHDAIHCRVVKEAGAKAGANLASEIKAKNVVYHRPKKPETVTNMQVNNEGTGNDGIGNDSSTNVSNTHVLKSHDLSTEEEEEVNQFAGLIEINDVIN
ncbi:hypothetical protein L1049_018225 [Liquidambar formosana]|uniref:DUF4283 domain-containing protein n=1 Tax=Liquidambar formosana TaxID=63359 RepID=A0AAP0WMH4_LIQFO